MVPEDRRKDTKGFDHILESLQPKEQPEIASLEPTQKLPLPALKRKATTRGESIKKQRTVTIQEEGDLNGDLKDMVSLPKTIFFN